MDSKWPRSTLMGSKIDPSFFSHPQINTRGASGHHNSISSIQKRHQTMWWPYCDLKMLFCVLNTRYSFFPLFLIIQLSILFTKAHSSDDRNGIFHLLSILLIKKICLSIEVVYVLFTNGSISFFSSSKSQYLISPCALSWNIYNFFQVHVKALNGKDFCLNFY